MKLIKFRKNGQISLEYIAIFSFAFMILVIFVGVIGDYKMTKSKEERQVIVTELLFSLQNEIVLAESVHDGYHRTFIVPSELTGGVDYNLTNTPTSIAIQYGGNYYSINTPLFSGTMIKGTNHLKKTNNNITLY